MNLPDYARAIERAASEYEEACSGARDRFLKALAAAKQEFFEDTEQLKAYVEEDRPRRTRDQP